MTSKEQIEKAWFSKAVQSTHKYDEKSFKEGAECGYNLAIGNVVEWLKKNLIETKDRDGHPSIESRSCRTVDEFINDIKQAMKL